jgi:hypothetical protein
LYDAGLMFWEEFDRPGAARAFRVVRPNELRGEHWFELEPAEGATVLRHTIEGSASGRYEAIWRERIEPLHDLILEALLDNIEAAIASGDLRVGLPSSRNTIADLTHRSPHSGAAQVARWRALD